MYDINIAPTGQRKYMNAGEIRSLLLVAEKFEPDTLTLCWMLSVTGCRISEALSLTEKSIDWTQRVVVIESLKKRRKGVFRSVPIPAELIDLLVELHGIDRKSRLKNTPKPLWGFCRMTAYRRIRKVMEHAELHGLHAVPKGLRHGFGVTAVQSQVPLNLVQRWLGHADMRTTALYAAAIGPEERSIATRVWKRTTPDRSDSGN